MSACLGGDGSEPSLLSPCRNHVSREPVAEMVPRLSVLTSRTVKMAIRTSSSQRRSALRTAQLPAVELNHALPRAFADAGATSHEALQGRNYRNNGKLLTCRSTSFLSAGARPMAMSWSV